MEMQSHLYMNENRKHWTAAVASIDAPVAQTFAAFVVLETNAVGVHEVKKELPLLELLRCQENAVAKEILGLGLARGVIARCRYQEMALVASQ